MSDRPHLTDLAVQPLLAVVTLALLLLTLALDILGLVTSEPLWTELATWDLTAAIAAGLVAGGAAILDLVALRPATAPRRIALARALCHSGALALAAGSLALRALDPAPLPSPIAIVLAALALGLLLAAHWLAAELRARLAPLSARDLDP